MIHTVVRGRPCNYYMVTESDEEVPELKFLVRTCYCEEEDLYVTDVYHLQEGTKDWAHLADDDPHARILKVDVTVEEVIKGGRKGGHWHGSSLWTDLCTHRPTLVRAKGTDYEYTIPNQYLIRKLSERHIERCQEIINGKYWFSGWAFP
jgi:hypothetical protein